MADSSSFASAASPSGAHSPDVARALDATRDALAQAARRANRDPASVALIAVSKTQAADRIRPALTAGHRVFGENRVQEAQSKWPALRDATPDPVTLHLIGPLQTNKVREAVALFDVIQTVDRLRLAQALATEMERQDRRLPVLIQVNTGEEPQKAGVPPREAEAFVHQCRADLGLDVQGLMAIPPLDDAPAPHFALLREIARACGLPILSMGMSGDFETAVAFGATHVRLGTRLFGSRPQAPA